MNSIRIEKRNALGETTELNFKLTKIGITVFRFDFGTLNRIKVLTRFLFG